MGSKRVSSPADVRAWAAEQGLKVGGRGRFGADVIKAFNSAHKSAPYRAGEFKPTVQVRATRVTDSGRKVPVSQKVNVTEVRAAARAAGVAVPERGRLANDILTAFVAGTLSTLAAPQES